MSTQNHPQNQAPKTRYLRTGKTVKEFALILGVAESSVWRLIRCGELPAIRVSPRCTRILARDGNEFIRHRMIPRRVPPLVGTD